MTPDTEARLLIVNLPAMYPPRARWLIGDREAPLVVERLRKGLLPVDVGPAPPGLTREVITGWSRALRELDVGSILASHRRFSIELLSPLDAGWPFEADPEPPVLLFHVGDIGLLSVAPAAAVVGTRRCTTVGRTVAFELGRGLASAGVAIVSGLALGIDGAAHRGALDVGGPVVGVVGSGLDVVYPIANKGLWAEVASRGLLLSEAPAGAKPKRWRFPARNRLIAALSDCVVVVESHGRGGALLTVDEAADRGKPVLVTPGSVLSSASEGTNELLVDGAVPVRSADDVLGHLGVSIAPPSRAAEPGGGPDRPDLVDPPDVSELGELGELILAETATGPVHLDRLLLAGGRSPAETLAAVQALVGAGLVSLDGSTVARR